MKKILLTIFLLVLFYFIAFFRISSAPIQLWDESRIALNAIEMYQDNNFIVSHINGNPEMWNTKPTLLIALQTVSMKIFGVNEFAIRFPSIIALILICFTLLFYSKKEFKNYKPGIISSFVLVTFTNFNNVHGFRTGDYDTLLIMFTTIFSISYYFYLKKFQAKYLYLFAITVSFSILTKSISGLMLMPGLLLYTIYDKKLIKLLTKKEFYFSIIIIIGLVSSYYLYRESINEGYIKMALYNDLGRYSEVSEEFSKPFYYYIKNFILLTPFWFIPLIIGSVFHKKIAIEFNKNLVFLILNILFFIIIISSSKTKFHWYLFPIYPHLALLLAIYIYKTFETITIQKSLKHAKLFLIIIFAFPVFYHINRHIIIDDSENFIKDNIYTHNKNDNIVICRDGYQPVDLFYIQKYQLEGFSIKSKMKHELYTKDIVYVTQDIVSDYIEKHYIYKTDVVLGNEVKKYFIESRKL